MTPTVCVPSSGADASSRKLPAGAPSTAAVWAKPAGWWNALLLGCISFVACAYDTNGSQQCTKLSSSSDAASSVGDSLNIAEIILLRTLSEKDPSFRVLDGHIVAVQQAIGVQKGRNMASEYVRNFVQDIKQSGYLAKIIADNNVRGLTIAK